MNVVVDPGWRGTRCHILSLTFEEFRNDERCKSCIYDTRQNANSLLLQQSGWCDNNPILPPPLPSQHPRVDQYFLEKTRSESTIFEVSNV